MNWKPKLHGVNMAHEKEIEDVLECGQERLNDLVKDIITRVRLSALDEAIEIVKQHECKQPNCGYEEEGYAYVEDVLKALEERKNQKG